MAVKPGDLLGEKYRVDALIGRGGMGHVFAATDVSGQAPPVAIKVVSRMTHDETLMARLHREVEAAARIKSEYVPHVFEVSDTDEREMYFVMERLVGEPLSQRMRDKGPLPWAEVLQIGNDVLRGLIDAHTAGVVHRDIKPSNVFLALKGGRVRAMVLDFGVCKTDGVDAERLTGTGESIGTVAYMAPEQIRGASKVDDRADLYAFGVLVFEMICGRLPHDGPSQMAILASKLENTPARLRDCSQVAVPDGLDALVAKALARDPKERFSSAQELLKAWRKLGNASVDASSPVLFDTGSGPTLQGLDEAPTALAINDDVPTVHGNAASIPPEAHPTQTALTAGISLRKGSPGRIALGLAAFALVAGVVGVIVAFTRAPAPPIDLNAESQAAAALGAPPPAAEGTAAVPSLTVAVPIASAGSSEGAEPIELGDAPAPPSSAKPAASHTAPPAVAAPPAPRPGRPSRPSGPSTAKPGGQHITSQPRY